MADGDIDEDLRQFGAVVQSDGETVANGPFRGVMVVQSDLGIFDTTHLRAEGINSRISRNVVLVILCNETSVNQRHRNLDQLERGIVTMY